VDNGAASAEEGCGEAGGSAAEDGEEETRMMLRGLKTAETGQPPDESAFLTSIGVR
jgi:hypothetical protein